MFSLLHLALSFSPHVLTISVFHVLITTSCSVFLSTCPNHISLPCSHYYILLCISLHVLNHHSLASLIFSLMFATPALALISSFLIFPILFIPVIHLNSLICVLSSKFCSAFLSAQVSLPCIRKGLMRVL